MKHDQGRALTSGMRPWSFIVLQKMQEQVMRGLSVD
jgi:hypothetical protein